MLETQGRVVAVEPGLAWVESARQSGCGSCSAQGSCGTRLLGEALAPGAQSQVLALDPLGVQVGDTVLIGIAEEGGLRAAWLLYGLPVAGLLLGLILAQPLGDLWAVLAGAGGMLGALLAVHFFTQRKELDAPQGLQPVILARLRSGDEAAASCFSKTIPIKPV
ncbi:MAG: SoxR reducing system RseC family protein [Pseudomonadota bacterium]